jgi:hypothetical protein
MEPGAKRARPAAHTASTTAAAGDVVKNLAAPVNHAAEPSSGRPRLLLVKTELQSWLGKKYCDEVELLHMLFAHSIIRHVRTIEVEVRPLGGDSFKIELDARRPLVSEVKAEIARAQGTREVKQELYKVATRADGGAVREDDAAPELLDDDDRELRGGEVVAMAVKEIGFEPLHAREERTLEGHTHYVECLATHSDKLLSGSIDNTIKVWNTNSWACERTLDGGGALHSLAVLGNTIFSSSDNTGIKVWNTDTWTCERMLDDHFGGVWSLAVHGDKLLSGSEDNKIKVWSTDTWACEHTLEGHHGDVFSLAMYGGKLLSGSGDETIKVWSTDTWTCERTLRGHDGSVLSLAMYGGKLLSSSQDHTIKVWSTDTWACEGTLAGHHGEVNCLVVHDDKLISCSCDWAIKVWSTDTWTCEHTLRCHNSVVNCLVVYGDKLLGGYDDGLIKVCGS